MGPVRGCKKGKKEQHLRRAGAMEPWVRPLARSPWMSSGLEKLVRISVSTSLTKFDSCDSTCMRAWMR